ncbi:LysR family transcriptional regulator [Actinomadura fulvescens]|uniref:LysR family transcriptional regulator n=1 Tax=Actinomadura fulvescens TaxID=46160 RepID=A0ABN3PWZ2_9ACTN
MDGFEVRELRYFVAVAEELSFSRAAARLGIAQPPLSRAVKQLERRLGADLFQRDTHKVTLTDLGRSLLEDARDALDVMSAVSERARRQAQAHPGLAVTAKPGAATEMLRRIVGVFTALPDVPAVEVKVSGYRQQAAMVRDGRADVALVGSPLDRWRLEFEVLKVESRVAALPAGHRLAERERLSCADLHGEPMPRCAQGSPAHRAYLQGRDILPEEDECVPGPVVNDPEQLLEVVGFGQAVALVPAWLAGRNPRPDVVYRPVIDASPYVTAIAWRQGARSTAIAQFVRTATDLYNTAH